MNNEIKEILFVGEGGEGKHSQFVHVYPHLNSPMLLIIFTK